MNETTLVSAFFGYVSIACWIFVLVPQIHLNYKRKSCEGVSLVFYALWSLGDVFNLTGALLENLLFTAILLPLYYIFTDIIVLSQFYIYRNRPFPSDGSILSESSALLERDSEKPKWSFKRLLGWLCVLVFMFICVVQFQLYPERMLKVSIREILAQLCGYLSAAVYLGAYIPQIAHNYRTQSTEGLSMVMFIVVTIANITYCLSILTAQAPTFDYLCKYASWLLGASGTIWLELIILYQFYIYRHSSSHRE
ncbi:putative vacuolar membrane transporter for cationic amino acids [Coemansia brasiliensis]|uniref:Vacuolar membrane transporter for cationic amino acids n=1 Tax=Coemansia brasiliensis TaxID=2650707 RepID=A0A9W8I332_9FUNG|nr:putative vacuolar membrane transporter for cationic amino acids [Coemansia brasiliensis]